MNDEFKDSETNDGMLQNTVILSTISVCIPSS